MSNIEDFDSADIIDIGDVEVPKLSDPSNQSNQIVNFVNIHSDRLPSLNSPTNADKIESIVELYKSYNKQYGFDIDFHIDELSQNFRVLIDPKNRKVFELYLSEVFGISRLVFYQRGLLVINNLMEQISNPAQLNDPSLTIEYKFGMLSQMISLMQQFNVMFQDIKISDVDIQLKNIERATTSEGTDSQLSADPKILEVMDQLKNTILNKDKENE
jgi:hypothetical protein